MHEILSAEPALRSVTCGGTAAAAVQEGIRSAFLRCDDQILRMTESQGTRDGSTALVVLRLGASLYVAHAGDSRAVLARGARAERLTADHKPDLPRERARVAGVGGRIEYAGCWRIVTEPPGGRIRAALAVSRSLGDMDFKRPRELVSADPDVSHVALAPDVSFVVLASDGEGDSFYFSPCGSSLINFHSSFHVRVGKHIKLY